MLGQSIKAIINYTDDFGTAEEITSIKSDPVAIENSDPIGAAEVIGKDVEGELLNSDVQITDADGLGAFSYQWFRDNSPLIGETNSTYWVDRQDVGASIMFSVNYTDGRTTESFFSTPTVISLQQRVLLVRYALLVISVRTKQLRLSIQLKMQMV